MTSRRLASQTLCATFAVLHAAGCGPSTGQNITVGDETSTTPEAGMTGDFTTVASDSYVSATLAVTPTTIYWVDRGDITDVVKAMPVAGGTPTEVYAASPDPTAAIEDLAIDETNIYVTQVELTDGNVNAQVRVVPLDGSAPRTLVSTGDDLDDLVASGGYVYYSDGFVLYRVPVGGGDSETVSGTSDSTGIEGIGAVYEQAGVVYWTVIRTKEDGNLTTELEAVTTPGGKPTMITTFGGSGQLLAGDGSNLFWVSEQADFTYELSVAPAGGAKPRVLATTSGTFEGLVADDANVYFLEEDSYGASEALVEAPINGGDTVTLAAGITPAAEGGPSHSLALDTANVYLTATGSVLRVPK